MKVVIFDTETTGKDEKREIIEVALVEIAPGNDLMGASPDLIDRELPIASFFVSRFRPVTQPVTFGAMAVHHILPDELVGCPPSTSFEIPRDTAYLIGHSIDFDWEAAGAPPSIKRICTHAIAQHVWPNASGHSQSALLYMLEGATPATRDKLRNAHSAAADVELNRTLLKHILTERVEISRWSELWQFSEDCRIPLTCPMKRYEGVLLADLDPGFVQWCLDQHWLDPYFRKGLERVVEAWHAPRPEIYTNVVTETVDDDGNDIPF